MKDSTPSFEALLTDPSVARHLSDDEARGIRSTLQTRLVESRGTNVSRFFAAFGAWLSAVCMVVFLAVNQAFESAGTSVVIGALMIGVAIALQRTTTATFPGELSLALAISGNIAIVIGAIYGPSDGLPTAIITHALVGTVVYILFTNATYRFLAPLALATLLTLWFLTESELTPFFHILIAGEVFLLGLLHARFRDHRSLQPIFHALIFALPATFLHLNLWGLDLFGDQIALSMWPSNFVCALALLLLCRQAAADPAWWKKSASIGTVAAVLLLAGFTTPGLLVALGLLILGKLREEPRVQTLAHGFLIGFLWIYYYTLDVDLAYKSFVVAGTGVVLLVLRKFFPANETPIPA